MSMKRDAITVLLVAVAFGTVVIGRVADQSPRDLSAGRPGGRSVLRVASFSQLEPITPGEKERAGWLGHSGPDLTKTDERTVWVIADGVAPAPPPPWAAPRPSPTEFEKLVSQVCGHAAVFVGHPEKLRVYFGKGRSWLITDFTIRVERSIRPASLPATLLVTQGRGEVFVGNDFFQTGAGPALLEIGQSYIFVANQLRKTDSYWATVRRIDFGTGQVLENEAAISKVDDYTNNLVKAAKTCAEK